MNPDHDVTLTPEQIDAMVAAVQAAFRHVGPMIVERAGKVNHLTKDDGSPVTDTDVEVEDLIRAEVSEQFPSVPIYGEEGTYENDMQGSFWLIDPIDGTKSFIQNVPVFTTMGVFIQDGHAVASVIYNPSTDSMYVAQRGSGAYKNGSKLDLTNLPMPAVAACKEEFLQELNEIVRPRGVECEVTPTGVGHDFGMVAEGTYAARFNLHAGGYTHDYAPGALLVQEAGGVIVPISENTYDYQLRSFVGCHPHLAEALQASRDRLRELEGDWPSRK